jgi:O-antigen ligase
MFVRSVSIIGLLAALVFAVCFAPSLEPFAPGGVMLLLAVGLGGGVAGCAERPGAKLLSVVTGLVVLYLAWRMMTSPVADFGRSDGMLLAAGAATCFWAGWLADRRSHRALVIGVAALALANVGVALIQESNPQFTPIFSGRKTTQYPSGFYGHYNHYANFLLAAVFLFSGLAAIPGDRRRQRILWGVIAAACIFGIALSRSRGAMLGLLVGFGVLGVTWLIDLKRRHSRWFGPGLLTLLLAIPLAGLGWWTGARILLAQRGGGDQSTMSGDSGRLEFANMALQTFAEHPATGGGARSYSYEVFRFWNPGELWVGSGDVDMVHNEFLQLLTDYGLVGAAGVGIVLLLVGLRGAIVLGIEADGTKSEQPAFNHLAGALAAIAAMLTQSMFSFVLHMVPDVMIFGAMLGIVIAQPWPFAWSGRSTQRARVWLCRGLAISAAIGLIGLGWRDVVAWWLTARPGAIRAADGPQARYRALDHANGIRPDFRLENAAAETALQIAEKTSPSEAANRYATVVAHLEATLKRHPFLWATKLRLARLLDVQGRFEESESHYRALLPLLDAREFYYRARFAYGSHCYRRGYTLWRARRPEEGLAWAIEGRRQMELSRKLRPYGPESAEGKELAALEQFIRWLEGAQIKPASVVPPI